VEPFHAVATAEEEALVRECLASLGDDDRCLIELRFFDGATFAELGELLDCSEATAYRRVVKALNLLAGLFKRTCSKNRERLSPGAHFRNRGDE
jgi:RNA polymerase sigma factor (sigma-70 family)